MSKFTEEQLAVIEAMRKGESIAAEAVAGAGKTTVIIAGIEHVPHPTGLLLAFNKPNAVDLAKKIQRPGYEAKTMNGLGHGVWGTKLGRRLNFSMNKTSDNLKLWQAEHRVRFESDEWKAIMKGVSLCKSLGLTPGILNTKAFDAERLVVHMNEHGIDPDVSRNVMEVIHHLLKTSVTQAWAGTIDFDDQLYMPVIFNAIFPTWPFVAVDEAQDLSPLQHEMFARVRAQQRVVIGDPHQAIYAFRGASSSSFDELVDMFNLQLMPMTYSFRCPQVVAPFAQAFVPHFKSFEANPQGEVRFVHEPELVAGNTIVCRYNGPLVGIAFQCIRKFVPVNYLGRDFLSGLKALNKKYPTKGDVEIWRAAKVAEAKTKGAKQRIQDQAASLLTLHDMGASVDSVLTQMMVESKAGNAITLSTVHKIKGMEAPNITYLNAETDLGDGDDQEGNISYVALTRTTNILQIHKART